MLVQKQFQDIFTFSRASTGTRINAAGVLETVAANQPRFDYDPVTLQPKGLLIEEQRTNYLQNSEGNFSTGYPVVQNGVTKTIIGSGNSLGFNYVDIRCQGTTTATYFDINLGYRDEGVPVGDVTSSFYYRLLSVSGGIPGYRALSMLDYALGWSAGQSVSTGLSSVGVGAAGAFYAISKAARADRVIVSSSLSFGCTVGQTVDFVVRVGAPMIENGAFRTSYIPTSGSQVTRAADVCSINTMSPWWNPAEGTILIDFQPTSLLNVGVLAVRGDAENNFHIWSAGSNTAQFERWIGGAANHAPMMTNISPLARNKIALGYSTAGSSSCANGAAAKTASGGSTPSFSSLRLFGNRWGSGANTASGYVRGLRYFPKRLTDAQLQALTA